MITKAVIPAAGLGTRFLPVTKAQPKEMLPVVNKPVIQYVIEEVFQSDIRNVLLITGRNKRAIEDHLEKNTVFHTEECIRAFEAVLEQIKIHYIRQSAQRGLGDAVLHAETFVDGDPFALLLGDNITIPECICTLAEAYERYRTPIIAIETIPHEKIRHHGIVLGEKEGENLYKINDLLEKPESADSNLAIIGRYILTPEIFDYLAVTRPGIGGEIQLTDALREMLFDGHGMYAILYRGKRYDLGNNVDWLKANIELALADPAIGDEFSRWLHGILGEG